jgi:hypothetical protein
LVGLKGHALLLLVRQHRVLHGERPSRCASLTVCVTDARREVNHSGGALIERRWPARWNRRGFIGR